MLFNFLYGWTYVSCLGAGYVRTPISQAVTKIKTTNLCMKMDVQNSVETKFVAHGSVLIDVSKRQAG